MFREFLVGFTIAGILLYLLYLYLEWCGKYSSQKILYDLSPMLLMEDDQKVIESYGEWMLPEYLSDTFKPIRFWILYYQARYL